LNSKGCTNITLSEKKKRGIICKGDLPRESKIPPFEKGGKRGFTNHGQYAIIARVLRHQSTLWDLAGTSATRKKPFLFEKKLHNRKEEEGT